MKKFLLVFCLLLTYFFSFSQFVYHPDSTQVVIGTYSDLGNDGRTITTDYLDNPINSNSGASVWSSLQEIGFPFHFNRETFNYFRINTDGFIILDSNAAGTDMRYVLNQIAPFKFSLQVGGANAYRMHTSGPEGAKVCTIQFKGIKDRGTGSFQIFESINFQIKLYQGTDKIEFIYGDFIPFSGADMDVITSADVNLQIVNKDILRLTKRADSAWQDAECYKFYSFNFRKSILPVSGTTYRFMPRYFDVAIKAIYVLDKMPVPAGSPSLIQVRIQNNYAIPTRPFPLYLFLGAQSIPYQTQFSQTISLSGNADTIINFTYKPVRLGAGDFLVSTSLEDDIRENNQLGGVHEITTNLFSHADASQATGSFTHPGLMLTRYQMKGTAEVNKVLINIASGSVGTAVHAVVVNASGVIVAQSVSQNITAADIGTYMQFDIINPPSITDTSFYVGLAQAGNVAIGVQSEYPARPEAFYKAAITGGTLTEVSNGGRFMIQAGLKINGNSDLSIDAVYGLKNVPLRYKGSAFTGVKVKNNSNVIVSSLPVTFTVAEVPSFSTTILSSSIAPGDSAYIEFKPYFPAYPGTQTLRFSIPDDADNSNNSKVFTQVFTDSVYSHVDSTGTLLNAGFGTGRGMLLASFAASDEVSSRIKAVRVHISNDPANIGKIVRGVLSYASLYGLHYSDPYNIEAADLGHYKTFTFNYPLDAPLMVGENYPLTGFSVGLEQIGDGVTPYYPVSYMPFDSTTDGYRSDVRITDPYHPEPFYDGHLLIEAIAEPGTSYVVGPDEISAAPAELAGWRFPEGNSTQTAFASIFNIALESSWQITRGPGASAGAGDTFFQTTGFGNNGIATTNTDYFEVNLTPSPGRELKLDRILFDTKGDADFGASPGVMSQFAYSLNGVDFTLINTPVRTIPALDTFDYLSDRYSYVDLSKLPALQSIRSGTTVTFRYYASGQTTDGHWGFGPRGLSIYGWNSSRVLVDPVKPAGADYIFTDCNPDLPGSVHFKITGTPVAGHEYKAHLVQFKQDPAYTEFYRYYIQFIQVVGTLITDSAEGTIQLSIPSYVLPGQYYIYVDGTLSQPFFIKHNSPCTTPNSIFQSVRSGRWHDLSTWQSYNSDFRTWIPATHLPTYPTGIAIREADTVLVDQPAVFESLNLRGKMTLTNGAGHNGSISCIPYYEDVRLFGQPRLRIDSGGIFQVVSHNVPLDSMIKYRGEGIMMDVRQNAKVTIGDGSSSNGPGFHKFVEAGQDYFDNVKYVFRDKSVFEWNSTNSAFSLPMNKAFFTPKQSYYYGNMNAQTELDVAHPILRLTKLPPGNLGSGEDSIWVNGFVDVQTPITFGGTGRKVFRDGISGNATIAQPNGAGQLRVQSPTRNILTSPNAGTRIGLLSGNVQFQLNGAGLVFDQGITITKQSSIDLHGAALSGGNFTLEPAASLSIDTASSLTINNGNLKNEGMVEGSSGRILFKGTNTSTIRSASTLQPALELNNKQLSLAGNIHTTGEVKLTNNSRFQLGAYNLQMDSAALIADASNFIVTNDTGMLSRMVVSDSLLFPVGADNTTYSPLTLASVGDAGKSFSVRVKVGVLTGGLTGLTIDSSYVNRSWVIQKSDTTSSNASIQLQWPAGAEQPGFDRRIAYLSQLRDCGTLPDCNGVYYDEDNRQQALGDDPYSLSRSNISQFSNNHGPAILVVKSGPVVFRFTGNGNWNNPANWIHGVVPPLEIPRGMEVIVSPVTGGSCIVNGDITVLQGGKLTLTPGSTMEVRH